MSTLSFAQNQPVIFQLNHANKVISDSKSIPDFTHAEHVSLPNHWTHKAEQFYGSVWYEIEFNNTINTRQQWAIYLPNVNMNAEIWLNDVYLGSGGSMQKPISRYWHSPMIFSFSSSDLKKNNKFFIRVIAYANEFGHLGDIHVGEYGAINSIYSKTIFNTVNIHTISGILAGVYAILMSFVWYKRHDPVFFWGSLICIAWSISSMNFYVINPILGDLYWEKIMLLSMGWIPLLFFFFIRRLNSKPYHHYFDGFILSGAFIINIVMLIISEPHLFLVSRVFHIYSMLWGLTGVFIVFYSWLKYRSSSQFTMMIAFILIAVTGAHDILIQNHIIKTGEAFWLNYSVPIILLLIGYLMVSRFLNAVTKFEKLNHELESRVQLAQRKIQTNYEKIIMLETEQASSNERERIFRNLHDDMGAKLLSLVYKAENDEISTLARSAMNDLRDIVSKKPSQKYTLTELLEDWHHSTQKRCEEAGFILLWQQSLPQNLQLFMKKAQQNLMRVQTESITNILKHSSGKNIKVAILFRFECLIITVSDDGDYSNIEYWQEGRGLSNMRFRVKHLHGKIRWQAGPIKGGFVRWIIPLVKN
ncbi:MAG: hypothetical protein ISR69_00060 [Gammaproteobacteria bacterium]|nr:hypothetical protein [Gammaproteobacteria bacterium]